MQRVLEPELMEGAEQSAAYARADFSASNQAFVDILLQEAQRDLGQVLDIGCGPGDVMLRLARALPSAQITAVDGSAAMIGLAQKAIRAAGLQGRIAALQGYIPGLPLAAHRFDAVVSKDLLHHLPDPMVLWHEARRLGRRGAFLLVMDLIRPSTPQDAHNIVHSVAANEDALLKLDFFNSLCAAFTVDEVKAQTLTAGLSLQVSRVSDRHMMIGGTLP